MDQVTDGLTSSVQVLSLNKGLYLVAVKSASPLRVGDEAEFVLPAIHVGVGPGVPGGHVEILSGPRNNGAWLFENRDMLVIKVVTGPASVLLTSLRSAAMPPMEVEVQRLDPKTPPPTQPMTALPPPRQNGAAVSPPTMPATSTATPQLSDAQDRTPLRTRVSLHIQNKGDVAYVDNFWAGALGERLAIESFSISPLEGLRTDQIEYMGLTENGLETEWINGGSDCGSRGMATALAGFAVRAKPGLELHYECEYRGSFSSGKIIGPVKNGALCRASPGDRLEAMQIFIMERRAGADAPSLNQTSRVEIRDSAPEIRTVGPRFSVFRDNVE